MPLYERQCSNEQAAASHPLVAHGLTSPFAPWQYSAQDAEGGLAGFGHDIAQGLPEVCPHLEVTVVETKWANCWTSEGSGQGLDNAHYHGCLTYTHTSGQRNRFMEFSNAILSANKPAGILTRLNAEGKPVVSPTSDLNGVKIVDVSGWAPTADTLIYVKNSCAGDTPFNNWISMPAVAERLVRVPHP